MCWDSCRIPLFSVSRSVSLFIFKGCGYECHITCRSEILDDQLFTQHKVSDSSKTVSYLVIIYSECVRMRARARALKALLWFIMWHFFLSRKDRKMGLITMSSTEESIDALIVSEVTHNLFCFSLVPYMHAQTSYSHSGMFKTLTSPLQVLCLWIPQL